MILTEKLLRYQLYHQTKLVSMNILLEKKYYHLIKKKKVIEQAKFTYSLSGKPFEKQIKTAKYQGEEQIKALENQKLKE